MKRADRVTGGRGKPGMVASVVLAAVLAVQSGTAVAQEPAGAVHSRAGAARPLPGDAGHTTPILVEPSAGAEAAPRHLTALAATPTVRLYNPPGGESETMRAAAAVDLTRTLHLAGRAIYHPRPGVTMLDLEARVRAGTAVSLSFRSVTLHHRSGRRMPLQYRGRGRRFAIGIGIPFD